MMSEAESTRLDLASPRAWRRWVPSWFRSLVWVDDADKYDAFLSYSWKSDSKTAAVVHSVLQQFLCPWYRFRAKTIFRDLSCMPAGSSLQGELFDRIDRSTHLIVLASPEAAHSCGMELEANHWYDRRRDGQVLIIVTDGEFKSWEDIHDRLLPAAVRTNLVSEPLWIPLRHRRTEILNNPNSQALRALLVEDLKQVLLRLHAPRTWEELHGDERAQRRRALRIVWTFAFLFLGLALAAGAFALYAQRQKMRADINAREAQSEKKVADENAAEARRQKKAADDNANEATRQKNAAVTSAAEAQRQQHIAESRALAVQSGETLDRDQSTALNLAARAWQRARTPEANTAVANSFPQLSAILQGHTDIVNSAVFSPDGQRIVTASDDHTARVWNAASDQLLATLEGHTDHVWSAVFSPDGQRIVTASKDQTARVWNAAGGQLQTTLQGHTGPVRSAVFSPDGQRIVTASEDETARVWNAASGQLLTTLQGHSGNVLRAVFSPDGLRIVTANEDETARVWNAASGQLLATLQGHIGYVYSAVFSPDGQCIVTASNASRSQLDRLLDPQNIAVSLDTITRAARALGKRLIIRIADAKAG
jgi:hypothetical protein